MSEKAESARLKVKRAKKHIADLDAANRAFYESRPYEPGAKKHPQFPQVLQLYVAKAKPIPPEISLICGDALNCLNAALDHLAWQLVIAAGGKLHRGIKFPFAESIEKYKIESPGKVKGMSQEAIRCIDALKPYKGGNDALWQLHKLNNADKHRLLITVGSAVVAVGILARRMPALQPLVDHGYELIPDSVIPLKEGEVVWEILGPQPDDNFELSYAIAFGEPEIIEGKPVFETLVQFSNLVESVIDMLATFL